ncbi:MAG: sigma 54-interacting transcriptional regulator [Armatimonadetes bacterium]|nr:sigma 54-interacting transcriptional regulator [Armatimonadota bacterium]
MLIREIINYDPPVLNENKTLEEGIEILSQRNWEWAIITDNQGCPVGYIRKRHLFELKEIGVSSETHLSNLAKKLPIVIEETSIETVNADGSDLIVVVDQKGKMVGVSTRAQLIAALQAECRHLRGQLETARMRNQELEAILESSADSIYVTDGNGVTLWFNSACERLTGLRRSEVIGKHMRELVERGMLSDSGTLHVLRERKTCSVLQDVMTGKTLLVTSTPVFDENGNIFRVVSNSRDVTEMVKEMNQLKKQVEKSQELLERYTTELEEVRARQMRMENVVVLSEEMRKVWETTIRAARIDATVLIRGESGVGKEVIAKMLHKNGPRNRGPFIKINCASIPESLLESELFGYESGAFTGASNKGKAGLIELANKGTLFLDEIGELPLSMQAKLLQVIQDHRVLRLGGTKYVDLDIRIIAATNRDLEEMISQGQFREDLFYRLNVISIWIPPLRSRRDDIPALIHHFVNKFNEKYSKNKRISPETLDCLVTYSWPGNIRELENLVEQLVILTEDDLILPIHLPMRFRLPERINKSPLILYEVIPYRQALLEMERQLYSKAFQLHQNSYKVADLLKVSQPTAARKIKKYVRGLSVDEGIQNEDK